MLINSHAEPVAVYTYQIEVHCIGSDSGTVAMTTVLEYHITSIAYKRGRDYKGGANDVVHRNILDLLYISAHTKLVLSMDQTKYCLGSSMYNMGL